MVTRRMARARYFIFAAIVGVTALLGWRALQLEFDFSVDAVYFFDDPELKFYRDEVVPAFGASDNMLVLLVSADPLFATAPLAALVEAHHAIASIDGVEEVRSLVNVRVPGEREDAFTLLPLLEGGRAPQTPAQVDALAARAAHAGTVKGRLLSDDLSTTAIVVTLDPEAKSQERRRPLVEAAQRVVDEVEARAGAGVRLRLAGIPAISESITGLLRGDQVRFIPGVLAVMGLLLFFAFRSARGVALPFLATGTATLWTLGVMNLEGHSINVTNNAIVVLLLVIGVSDAVHLLARFEEEVRRQRGAGITVGKLKTVAVVTQHLGVACLLTSLTTAVGFGSLIAAKLNIIAEYGVDAAIGVLLAYVVTIGLIPALLGILPLPQPRRQDPLTRDLSDRFLSMLADFSLRHRTIVLVTAVAFTAVALYGASRVRPHDRILAELPEDHAVLETLSFASERLGGLLPFDLVIETPRGRADDPDVLEAIEALQRFVSQLSDAPRTLSVINLLGAVDASLRSPDAPPLPWSRERIAQYLLLVELDQAGRRELTPYLSDDRRLARIACFGDDMGTDRFLELDAAVRAEALRLLPADASLHVTGPLADTNRALTWVVRDMATSLALAMVIILAVMGLLFRSLRIGLLALIPNAIPVLMALGVMGFAGISLRPGTAVIFSMALGIAVDNAIHFLSRYREELTASGDVEVAVEAAVRGTGRPILYTTVMLSLGLCVLLASDFVALQHLAILGSTTFASAMVVDLLLLPVLLIWLRPR